jgi:hypothetical protein
MVLIPKFLTPSTNTRGIYEGVNLTPWKAPFPPGQSVDPFDGDRPMSDPPDTATGQQDRTAKGMAGINGRTLRLVDRWL